MAMVCPKCSSNYEQRWHCPTCQVRLSYRAADGPAVEPATASADTSRWQQTPWGRILVGLLLSQGIYFGLRQLVLAGFMAGGGSTDVWSTLYGLLGLQALQLVGLALAGLLAGAGQRQGLLFGAVVGVWNGVLSVILQSGGLPQTTVTLLGQPILHTAFGALGGFIGSRIWQPAITLTLPGDPLPAKQLSPAPVRPPLFAGPVAWGRMLTGVALAVGGTLWANVILELVLDAGEGTISVTSHLQAQLVTWEVTALAMLTGSAFAGACTTNSLKQGLAVGIAAGAVLGGIRLGIHQAAAHELVLTAASTLGLGMAGAWFGGNLFPPVVSIRRRKGFGPEAA